MRSGSSVPSQQQPGQRSSVLAVIPARGGSKGLPGKNLTTVGGRTLLCRCIEAALGAHSISRVVVSTDSSEIAEHALRCGAQPLNRPAELATDEASSESALLDVLGQLQHAENYVPHLLVMLQCTSPFTAPQDIDDTVRLVLCGSFDSAFSATPFHGKVWRYAGDELIGQNHLHTERLRRQDAPRELLESGAIYVMNCDGFVKHRHRFFGRVGAHIVKASQSIEIDDAQDLELARMLSSSSFDQREISVMLPKPVTALVMDFDGVFTDNGVLVSQDGKESALCSRGDGMGLTLLRRAGMPMLVLSSERNPIVLERCRKLGIEVLHNLEDKLSPLREWHARNGLDLSHSVYIGNDVNDLPCFGAVGCPVAVADAHPQALAAAKIVTSKLGGRGAIREVADAILTQLKDG